MEIKVSKLFHCIDCENRGALFKAKIICQSHLLVIYWLSQASIGHKTSSTESLRKILFLGKSARCHPHHSDKAPKNLKSRVVYKKKYKFVDGYGLWMESSTTCLNKQEITVI